MEQMDSIKLIEVMEPMELNVLLELKEIWWNCLILLNESARWNR